MDNTKTIEIAKASESRFEYLIGTPAQKYKINPWTMSMVPSLCGPIIYQVSLGGG
jgi:hypothetical protein